MNFIPTTSKALNILIRKSIFYFLLFSLPYIIGRVFYNIIIANINSIDSSYQYSFEKFDFLIFILTITPIFLSIIWLNQWRKLDTPLYNDIDFQPPLISTKNYTYSILAVLSFLYVINISFFINSYHILNNSFTLKNLFDLNNLVIHLVSLKYFSVFIIIFLICVFRKSVYISYSISAILVSFNLYNILVRIGIDKVNSLDYIDTIKISNYSLMLPIFIILMNFILIMLNAILNYLISYNRFSDWRCELLTSYLKNHIFNLGYIIIASLSCLIGLTR